MLSTPNNFPVGSIEHRTCLLLVNDMASEGLPLNLKVRIMSSLSLAC